MKENKIIYYSSENEEVASFKFRSVEIDANYKYIHTNPFYKLWSAFVYRCIATPLAFLVFKVFKRIKFHNIKVLKEFKKGGYFVYANHTNQFADGFCPALICFPKKPHIIVDSSNVNIPLVKHFTKMSGALPLPNDLGATKNFFSAISATLAKNNPILIYPEAHLWPYYTKIRNFSSPPFRYPLKFDKPAFAWTTVYKKSKRKKPKIEIYIDGPFYRDKNLNVKEAQQKLRDEIYLKMCERAKLSNCEYIMYEQRRNND